MLSHYIGREDVGEAALGTVESNLGAATPYDLVVMTVLLRIGEFAERTQAALSRLREVAHAQWLFHDSRDRRQLLQHPGRQAALPERLEPRNRDPAAGMTRG